LKITLVVLGLLFAALLQGQELTAAQKQALAALQADSVARTAAALRDLGETAKKYNANLLSEAPDPEIDRQLGQQMVDRFAELIRLRLARIHASAKALTAEQRRALAKESKKPGAPFLFDDLVKQAFGDPPR
jgi:Spy/CpxP family protein refolding chaperone